MFSRGSLLVGLGGKAQQIPTNISLPDIPRFVQRCLFLDISRQEDRKVAIGSQIFFLLGISSWSRHKHPTHNFECKYTMVGTLFVSFGSFMTHSFYVNTYWVECQIRIFFEKIQIKNSRSFFRCHFSGVTRHTSHVTCRISPVTCH